MTIDRRMMVAAAGNPSPIAPGSSLRPVVRFRRLPHGQDLPLPSYATGEAAGVDLMSAWSGVVPALGAAKIPTGYAVEIPMGLEGQVRLRSSVAWQGLIIPNAPGTIDSDYRGEVFVMLRNLTLDDIRIERGHRIAQLVIAPVARAAIVEADELSKTARGEGGFGSTGR